MRVIFTLRQHSVWKSVGLCRNKWLQFTPGLAAWPDMVEASEDTGTMSGNIIQRILQIIDKSMLTFDNWWLHTGANFNLGW